MIKNDDILENINLILDSVKKIFDEKNYISNVDIIKLKNNLEVEIPGNTEDELKLIIKIINTVAECYHIEKNLVLLKFLSSKNIIFSEIAVKTIEKIANGENIESSKISELKSGIRELLDNFKKIGKKTLLSNTNCYYAGITILLDDNVWIYALKKRNKNSIFKLVQSNEYVLHTYRYNTDSIGRIKAVQGVLQIPNDDEKTERPTLPEIGERLKSDDRGHLIAREFLGVDTVGNLVPMDWAVNQFDIQNGAYRKLENELKKYADNPNNNVYYMVKPIYNNGSRRPNGFLYKYNVTGIDNLYEKKIIKNTKTPRK